MYVYVCMYVCMYMYECIHTYAQPGPKPRVAFSYARELKTWYAIDSLGICAFIHTSQLLLAT
jgi:hypothetical protein